MNRRMRRQMARDVKKKGKMLNLPTEQDMMEYINEKLKDKTNVQLQETTGDNITNTTGNN
jgi:hypothetical protein